MTVCFAQSVLSCSYPTRKSTPHPLGVLGALHFQLSHYSNIRNSGKLSTQQINQLTLGFTIQVVSFFQSQGGPTICCTKLLSAGEKLGANILHFLARTNLVLSLYIKEHLHCSLSTLKVQCVRVSGNSKFPCGNSFQLGIT